MARHSAVHIDSFEAVGPIRRYTPYEAFRAAVLRAGRFSAFEATANQRAAQFYTQLGKDPTVKLTTVGFPWTKVEENSK